LQFHHGLVFNTRPFSLSVIQEDFLVFLRSQRFLINKIEFQFLVLPLTKFLLLTKILNQLINLSELNTFSLLCLGPIMRFDYHLEQFGRTSEQLMFGISQLLIALLIKLTETNLENILLIVSMGKLHEDEDVVLLHLADHVLAQHLQQRFHLEELYYGIVIEHFGASDFDSEAIETFEDV
jgi:hypothetical protein